MTTGSRKTVPAFHCMAFRARIQPGLSMTWIAFYWEIINFHCLNNHLTKGDLYSLKSPTRQEANAGVHTHPGCQIAEAFKFCIVMSEHLWVFSMELAACQSSGTPRFLENLCSAGLVSSNCIPCCVSQIITSKQETVVVIRLSGLVCMYTVTGKVQTVHGKLWT